MIAKKQKTLKIGEALNPDNLRYIDGQITSEAASGMWSSEYKAWVDSMTLKSLFMTEDWVFITVDSIALPISQCPISVYVETVTQEGKNKKDFLKEHKLSKMFANPNSYQSSQEIAYNIAVDLILGGNGFFYKDDFFQLFHLPFERVQYNFGKDGIPVSLRFFNQQQEDAIPDILKEISLTQIIHTKRPNPSSVFWGLSPFIPGRKSVLFNRYSADYLLAFYLKGATPQMILEVDKTTSEKNLVRMLRSFESAYTGRKNMRRTLVLPKGVTVKIADNRIVDQQLIEIIKNNRETALNILHVPKHVVGLQETGSLGSREHELALRWFWKQTILPTMGFIENSLNSFFRRNGMLLGNEKIGFDTSSVDYTQEDLLAQALVSKELQTVWTPNEIRGRIFGLAGLEGGDVLPSSQSPQFLDQFLKLKPQTEFQTTLSNKSTPEIQEPVTIKPPEKYKDILKKSEEELKNVEKNTKMTDVIFELFADKTEAILSVVDNMRNLRDDFDAAKFNKQIDDAIQKLENDYIEKYDKNLTATIKTGYNSQLSMVFDKKNKDAIEAYSEKNEKEQRKILIERGLFSFKTVKETTTNRVTALVEKSLKEGSTIASLRDKIVPFMKNESVGRAFTIARTETLTAFSVGKQALMTNATKVIPHMQKVWITSNDDLVRETHVSLMGESRDPSKRFSNGLQLPRDPRSRNAAECINCRCDMLLMPKEDLKQYKKEIDLIKE